MIDATLDELKGDTEYYPLFIFESSLELAKNLKIYRRASMFEFNLEQEEQFILPRIEIPLERNNPIIFRRYWNRDVQNGLLAFDYQSGEMFIANNACTVLNEYTLSL